jgi:NAD(P)-dependent dehydrogenase (short-subunit alcohol dehydrogenase family)
LSIDKDTHNARVMAGGRMPDRHSLRCLVTGASRGIGEAIVARLAGDGHRIALTARTATDLVRVAEATSAETLVLPWDATSPEAGDAVVGEVVRAWGGIDVLVLNAGEGVAAPLVRTDDAMWEQQLELNLTSPFRFMRAAIPAMKEQGFGRIVVVASSASKRGEPYIAAYTAAKHGVLGLVRSAAAEMAATGITVNAVCPGYVDTAMTQRSIDAIVAKTGRSREEAEATLASQQPTGRLVSPAEVADAVSFLIHDTGQITGQGLNIDGGKVQS